MAKSADPAYVEALLDKRIAFAKQIRQHIGIENSIAKRTTELYTSILDGEKVLLADAIWPGFFIYNT